MRSWGRDVVSVHDTATGTVRMRPAVEILDWVCPIGERCWISVGAGTSSFIARGGITGPDVGGIAATTGRGRLANSRRKVRGDRNKGVGRRDRAFSSVSS